MTTLTSNKSKMLDIPGYSRYGVLSKPFRVVNKRSGHILTPHINGVGRGNRVVSLIDDNGKHRKPSIAVIACLAFHGQRPRGCAAIHYGGEYTPKSCRWVPSRIASIYWMRKHKRRKLSWTDREKIQSLYMNDGMTQDEIASRYGVAQATICRVINGGYSS